MITVFVVVSVLLLLDILVDAIILLFIISISVICTNSCDFYSHSNLLNQQEKIGHNALVETEINYRHKKDIGNIILPIVAAEFGWNRKQFINEIY